MRSSLILSLFTASTIARNVPENMQDLYDRVKAQGQCNNPLASGLYSYLGGPPDWSYCGDHLDDYGIIYVQGKNGLFDNMDIDCDGVQQTPNSGRCGHNPTDQGVTSFQTTVAGYGATVTDLDPYIHPYVVFGNDGTKEGYVNFDPQKYGVQGLSVMAVLCGNGRLVYGVWGDFNGGERAQAYVGEASLATGELCFGDAVNGSTSHDPNDVMYIAFRGSAAVPGAGGADWAAKNSSQFEKSIRGLGDALVARIPFANGTMPSSPSSSPTVAPTPPPTPTCDWPGHCAGDGCSTDDDCAGDLECGDDSKKCAEPTDCSWQGHCAGASCKTQDDCSGQLVCTNGRCAQA